MNSIRNNLVIELHVPDFVKAKEFYGSLGFEVIQENKPTSGEKGYLVMKRKDDLGDSILNFYCGDERVYEQRYFKKFSKDTPRGYAVEITIPIKNVRGLYEKIKLTMDKNIVRELMELKDNGAIWQDFRMTDPFGFYLRFTEIIDWGQ